MEMENRLMANGALDEAKLGRPRLKHGWKGLGYQENVDLSYRLVMLLRQKASEIQQRKLDFHEAAPFADEYLPALLYHTVRVIGHPSLSLPKRLLAVHSAGSILNRLNDSWCDPRHCDDPWSARDNAI
jgi:hypothetical protein